MYCLADSIRAELNSKTEMTGSFKMSAFRLLKCLAALCAERISTTEMLGSFIIYAEHVSTTEMLGSFIC